MPQWSWEVWVPVPGTLHRAPRADQQSLCASFVEVDKHLLCAGPHLRLRKFRRGQSTAGPLQARSPGEGAIPVQSGHWRTIHRACGLPPEMLARPSPILTKHPLNQVPLPLTHSPHRGNCHGSDNGAELISTMPGHLRPPRWELGQCSFGTQGRLSAGPRAEVGGGPHTPILLSRAPPHSHLFLLSCTLATFCVTFAGVCLSGWLHLPLPGTDHTALLPTPRPASQSAWHQRGGSTSWKVTDLFWGGGVHRSLSRRHPGVNTCNGVRASPPLIHPSASSW